jgi:predicted esterase YcpF (UPF0227 family)
MRIWYFHGLESKPGGKKVEFLHAKATMVFAPAMEYDNPDYFATLLAKAEQEKPDLVIGSSMGGYFADALASHTGTAVLLFNPALHSRSKPIELEYGSNQYTRNIVVGAKDAIINPEITRSMLTHFQNFWVEPNMEHRTPLPTFEIYVNRVLDL